MVRLKRTGGNDSETQSSSYKTVGPDRATQAVIRRRKRRGRTSSERGKAFRDRQRKAEIELEDQIEAMRRDVQDKLFLRGVWEAKYQRARHSLYGSLVALVREYYGLFRNGLRDADSLSTAAAREHVVRQETFLLSNMDADAATGVTLRGPQASIDQWRLHTSAFQSYSVEIIGEPIIIGFEEHPVVILDVCVTARVSHEILSVMFPPQSRVRAAALLSKCMGKLIQFRSRNRYAFTPANRIAWELVEVDYVQGFMDAGLSLREVAELLSISKLSPHS